MKYKKEYDGKVSAIITPPDFVNDSPDLTSPPGWLGQTGG